MAFQYARPDSDVSASNWTGSYTAIDESIASDADYIVGANTANGTFECGLSNVASTPTTTTCTIRFRARQSAAPGNQRQVSVQVFQGATAKGAAVSSGNLTATWTAYSSAAIDLSGVTDWTDLRFRIVSTGDTGTPAASRRYVWVSWAELETPEGVVTSTGTAAITLTASTLSSAGDVSIEGTAAITLTGATLTSAGEIDVNGSAGVTLTDSTLSSEGVVENVTAHGEADITLADTTATSAGAVTIQGTSAIQLSDATLLSVGAVGVSGAASITLEDSVLSSLGSINTERPSVTLTSPDDAGTVIDRTPSFEFIGTDADGDGLEYQIQVLAGAVCDSYDESNFTTPFAFGTTIKAGQSFSGNNKSLKSVEFYLQRYGLPNGTIRAVLYAHSGTFGSSSVPTGDPIAVSDVKQMGDLDVSYNLVEFVFTTNPTLSDTYYVVALEVVDKTLLNSSNTIRYGTEIPTPTHPGNFSSYVSSWVFLAVADVIFYVNTLDALIDAVSTTDPGFENLDTPENDHPFNENESIRYTVQEVDELEEAIYFWSVRANDGFGWGEWSDVRSFTVNWLINGEAEILLSDLSLSSAGSVEIEGAASITLDDLTLSAEGSVTSGEPISGSAAITLDDLSLSSAGTVAVEGDASITLDDLSLGSAGSVGVSGQSDITLDDLTASSVGAVTISGSAAITLDDVTSTSAGTVAIDGEADITLADITLSAEGVIGSLPISGSAAITLDDLTATSTGVVSVSGDADITLDDLTATSAGTVSISGSAVISFDDMSLSAGGAVTIDGDASITLDDLTCAATATTETNLVLGSLDVTLDDLVLASAGEVDIAGAVGVTLEDMTLDSSAAVALFGQAVIVLDDMSLTSVGTVYFAAAIELTLAPRGFSFDLLERDFTWTLVEDDYSWNLEERSTSLTLEDRV